MRITIVDNGVRGRTLYAAFIMCPAGCNCGDPDGYHAVLADEFPPDYIDRMGWAQRPPLDYRLNRLPLRLYRLRR